MVDASSRRHAASPGVGPIGNAHLSIDDGAAFGRASSVNELTWLSRTGELAGDRRLLRNRDPARDDASQAIEPGTAVTAARTRLGPERQVPAVACASCWAVFASAGDDAPPASVHVDGNRKRRLLRTAIP